MLCGKILAFKHGELFRWVSYIECRLKNKMRVSDFVCESEREFIKTEFMQCMHSDAVISTHLFSMHSVEGEKKGSTNIGLMFNVIKATFIPNFWNRKAPVNMHTV